MTVQFGEVVVSVGSRTIERSGQPVHLSPKAFDLLTALIARRPDVARTEELHALLWPGVHVGQTSLPALVSEIRSALGETPRDGSCIRTLPRVGYAFVADARDRESEGTGAARVWLVAGDRWIPVSDGIEILGREGASVIAFPEATVSRQHARLHISHREVLLEDLGSKNGTWMAGIRLQERTPLHDGDRFLLGSVDVRVSFTPPPATTKTLSAQAFRDLEGRKPFDPQ